MLVRVLSWNIHKCTGGLDRRYDPARTANLIASCAPDLVLLQEVAEDGTWYRGERQVDVLGDLLGLPHRSYFVNVRFGVRRGSYGNAVLSRFPIVATENIDITQPGKKQRSILHAEVRLALDGAGRWVEDVTEAVRSSRIGLASDPMAYDWKLRSSHRLDRYHALALPWALNTLR